MSQAAEPVRQTTLHATAAQSAAGPAAPARVIRDDAEAIRTAHELAARFAREASVRDRERRLPVAEIEEFSQSGLWAITVPRAFGGAGVSWATLTEVIKIISAVDPSIGQIPQNHLFLVDALRVVGAGIFNTRMTETGEGLLVNGRKFYATGALLAHRVMVAVTDDAGKAQIAIVPRDAPGMSVIDDWSSFGQRTTASGTVLLENVRVTPDQVLPIHAAIDSGIAKGTIADMLSFVRSHARPWIDSGQEHGFEDMYTIAQVGDLEIRLHAAEALLERAARAIEAAIADRNEDTVAEARALSDGIAVLASNKLFEFSGARSTLEEFNFDRHWRNARTHTLHDPVRWKYHAVGNYYLNGVKPPRHAWL